jgi:hypothetical protein
MLIFTPALRNYRINLFTDSNTPRSRASRLLHLSGRPNQHPKMSLPIGTFRLLGIFPRENIDRQHASSLRDIQNMASGTLDFDRYPVYYGNWVEHLPACSVPPHPCYVGTCA